MNTFMQNQVGLVFSGETTELTEVGAVVAVCN